MSKTNVCQALEDVIDGLTGEVTEKGWEGLDRYYKRPFKMYSTLLSLLKLMDEEAGNKAEDMAIQLGLMEIDIKKYSRTKSESFRLVTEDSGPPWEDKDSG